MAGGTGTTCNPDCLLGPAYDAGASRYWLGSEFGDADLTPERNTTVSNPEQYESEIFGDLGQSMSFLDIIQAVPSKDNARAVHELGHLMMVRSQADWLPATQHMTFRAFESSSETSADWERWHELLSIRDSRGMNPSEQREYEEFEAIVAEQDAQEEARSNAALDLLEEKHALVISSIERLTVAVRKAAQRDR